MYEEFIQTLNDMDLPKYDEYVNIAVQEAAAEAGVDLKEEQPGK